MRYRRSIRWKGVWSTSETICEPGSFQPCKWDWDCTATATSSSCSTSTASVAAAVAVAHTAADAAADLGNLNEARNLAARKD